MPVLEKTGKRHGGNLGEWKALHSQYLFKGNLCVIVCILMVRKTVFSQLLLGVVHEVANKVIFKRQPQFVWVNLANYTQEYCKRGGGVYLRYISSQPPLSMQGPR